MKFLSAVAALATVATLAQADVPSYPGVINCAAGFTDQNVTAFTVTPAFCVGKNFTLTFTGPLSTPIIDGATLTIIGRYLQKIVYTDTANNEVCSMLAAAGTPCPVPVTTTSWSIQRLLKPTLPSGIPFSYQFLISNGNGHIVACQSTVLSGSRC